MASPTSAALTPAPASLPHTGGAVAPPPVVVASPAIAGSTNMVAQTLVLRHDHAQSAAAAGDEQRTDAEHAPRYVHIKTPLRQGGNTMNRYDIVGMIFGSGCAPLDLTFLSYTYEGSACAPRWLPTIHRSQRQRGPTVAVLRQ
jgi:hypothetical protein